MKGFLKVVFSPINQEIKKETYILGHKQMERPRS